MRQCRIISYNKYLSLVGNIDNGGSSPCVGADGIWKISGPSTQLCWEPTISLKINNIKIIIINNNRKTCWIGKPHTMLTAYKCLGRSFRELQPDIEMRYNALAHHACSWKSKLLLPFQKVNGSIAQNLDML